MVMRSGSIGAIIHNSISVATTTASTGSSESTTATAAVLDDSNEHQLGNHAQQLDDATTVIDPNIDGGGDDSGNAGDGGNDSDYAGDGGNDNDNADDDEVDEQVDEVEPDECCICRDVVALATQGLLPKCDHKFHFECIVAWSKVTNLCPLCKQPFQQVTRVDASGAVVHCEPIQDTKQVFRPDPADHDIAAQLRLVNEARCEICGRGDDEHVLLMCEARGCPIANHTYCIGLDAVPRTSWYCARHATDTRRASDFIERQATTVSSRRTTRRLAHLMSNVLSGRDASPSAARRGGRNARSSPTSTTRTNGRRAAAAAARVTLESDSGRPIRGIAAAYALRMSRELQQIHRRAELMYERGDHHAPSTRSTTVAQALLPSSVDLMWRDFDASRREIAATGGDSSSNSNGRLANESASPPLASRVSRTLVPEYRALAKLMVDAVASDNYASTVSLLIPKTAKLRLVSRVKTFFARLNSRERIAVLDMGCLDVLLQWLDHRSSDTAAAAAATASSASVTAPHPQVLDAVLTVVETLPVRQKDLLEVPRFQQALDDIATLPEASVALRERAIIVSERWRDLNPPPRASLEPVTQRPPTAAAVSSSSAATNPSDARPPAIRAFAAQKQQARRPKQKMRPQEAWTQLAVDYVKAKLYPLYKHGNGKLTKDRFKAIVKHVLELFRVDAASMQSRVVTATGELSSIAKTRLKTLIDRSYKTSSTSMSHSGTQGVGATAAEQLASSSSYSALPPTKHRRTT